MRTPLGIRISSIEVDNKIQLSFRLHTSNFYTLDIIKKSIKQPNTAY